MNRLKEVREALGWSATKLGAEARISEQHVRRIENGEVRPHPLTITSLAKATGQPEHYLFPKDEVEEGLD